MLQAELSHLAQQRNTPEPARDHYDGSKKSVLAAETKLTLDIPHDHDSSLSPSTSGACRALAIRSFALYACCLPVHEIRGHLTGLYGLDKAVYLALDVQADGIKEILGDLDRAN